MAMANAMRGTGQGVVVLSCSDPRLNPYQILGIDGKTLCTFPMQLVANCTHTSAEGTMVRNAGGQFFDAIRTLSVLQIIGQPGTIVVMHHTGKTPHSAEEHIH